MRKGKPIKVYRKVETGRDDMDEPVFDWVSETVKNVLYLSTRATNLTVTDGGLTAGARFEGTSDTITVYFPKTYTKGLQCCELEVYEKRWSVQGDPQPLLWAKGKWNRTVTAKKVDG